MTVKDLRTIQEGFLKTPTDQSRLRTLAASGLVDSSQLPMLKRLLNKDPSKLTAPEKQLISQVLDTVLRPILDTSLNTRRMSNLISQEVHESVTNPGEYQGKYDPRGPKGPASDNTDLPSTLVLRRKAIRVYPDNQKVGLYYSQELDKYVSIPAGNNGVAVAEEAGVASPTTTFSSVQNSGTPRRTSASRLRSRVRPKPTIEPNSIKGLSSRIQAQNPHASSFYANAAALGHKLRSLVFKSNVINNPETKVQTNKAAVHQVKKVNNQPLIHPNLTGDNKSGVETQQTPVQFNRPAHTPAPMAPRIKKKEPIIDKPEVDAARIRLMKKDKAEVEAQGGTYNPDMHPERRWTPTEKKTFEFLNKTKLGLTEKYLQKIEESSFPGYGSSYKSTSPKPQVTNDPNTEDNSNAYYNPSNVSFPSDKGRIRGSGWKNVKPTGNLTQGPSRLGSAVQTVDQGVRAAASAGTLGLADKAAAAMDTITKGGSYADNLSKETNRSDQAIKDHPITSALGQAATIELGGRAIGVAAKAVAPIFRAGKVVSKAADAVEPSAAEVTPKTTTAKPLSTVKVDMKSTASKSMGKQEVDSVKINPAVDEPKPVTTKSSDIGKPEAAGDKPPSTADQTTDTGASAKKETNATNAKPETKGTGNKVIDALGTGAAGAAIALSTALSGRLAKYGSPKSGYKPTGTGETHSVTNSTVIDKVRSRQEAQAWNKLARSRVS